MAIRLSFHGAAGCVTGSKFLLETDKASLLVDCGLFQGRRELRKRNWDAPAFNPANLSAVVLTHAHIDHTGYLPVLLRHGFSGPVYCTAATKELLHLLLPDSAHLQEEEARYANKHKTSRHKPAKPLYTQADAKAALKLIKVIPRGESSEILPGVHITPSCAGHILGSTSLNIRIGKKTLTFSGDIGRYDTPLLPDPEPVELGSLLLCESTYGDRDHKLADTCSELAKVVNLAQERNGALVIPAFAIGRTQNILFYLAQLEREGRIPALPVFIDSPMAVDATKIYRQFRHDYDEQASALLEKGHRPLATEKTLFCRSRDESKRLNKLKGARIIISASGMVNGGRILHHMRHLLPQEETTVLFVGYQAEGTRGRTIQNGEESVKIFGDQIPIRADVQSISGLSAHGDRKELLRWLKSSSGAPENVRIIHGEPDSSRAFASLLSKELSWNARPAEYLEQIEV